jgi:hypothetical protein
MQSYSLGGMGCGTGVLGIKLVADILKVRTAYSCWQLLLTPAPCCCPKTRLDFTETNHDVWLQARPNSITLFVPAEITSCCYYPGKQTNYSVANVLFRYALSCVLKASC